MENTLYEARGVSTTKSDVHDAIKSQDPGLFPGAFCKILPDYLAGDPDYCVLMHADGAGTKALLAYLAWKEGLPLSIWSGIIWDSLIMNFEDAGCAGFLGPFMVSTTIGRNKFLIPGEVIATIINACEQICEFFTNLGIPCFSSGGETADIADLVRTITIDNTIVARMKRHCVINASNMVPGDIIVGFSSTGLAKWEKVPTTGIGSNGLTNARHDTLRHTYAEKYPEIYAPEIEPELVYRGNFTLEQNLPGDNRFTIASALLSPTRTYLPLIKILLENISPKDIHGLIHCSGGGQTKIKNFGQPGNRYIKNSFFTIPPVFAMLKNATGMTWREMYQVYNMGHRLEAVVPEEQVNQCIVAAKECNIETKIIGYVEGNGKPQREVVIRNSLVGEYTY